MSKENKTQNINANFDKVLNELNELKKRGVKAFILLAVTDEPAKDGDKKGLCGINAASGSKGDLVNLYKNIDKEISVAASMEGFCDFLGKLLKDKDSENE